MVFVWTREALLRINGRKTSYFRTKSQPRRPSLHQRCKFSLGPRCERTLFCNEIEVRGHVGDMWLLDFCVASYRQALVLTAESVDWSSLFPRTNLLMLLHF